jgi:hypothetical protein
VDGKDNEISKNIFDIMKCKSLKEIALQLLLVIHFTTFVFAQNQPHTLTKIEKKEVVESINKLVDEYYISPELGKKLIAQLSKNLQSGVYDSITDPVEFEAKLDREIRATTNDFHFKVIFDADWVVANRKAVSPQEKRELRNQEFLEAKKNNFGFKDVRMLEGKVGYLKFTSFENPEWTAETLANAMNFLGNSDVLIIDLRNNSGGYSELAQILCSYFFDTSDVFTLPLFEISIRDKGKNILIQNNVLASVQGKKMLDAELYILTNYRSFSAAEWTSFVLQNRKRATIIGEKTIGGTHPAERKIVSDRFSINIPFGTMLDAVTKTHFEGIGVKPDIAVSAKDALLTAQIVALEKLSAKFPDNKANYDWHLQALRAKQKAASISDETLKSYIGKFGIITLLWENGKLISLREGIKTELIPIAQDLFLLEGRDDARFRILFENGKVSGLERLFEDGRSLKEAKEK